MAGPLLSRCLLVGSSQKLVLTAGLHGWRSILGDWLGGRSPRTAWHAQRSSCAQGQLIRLQPLNQVLRVEALSLWGPCGCVSSLEIPVAVALRKCVSSSANLLRRFCVLKRCAAVRMCLELDEPSATPELLARMAANPLRRVRASKRSVRRRANVSRSQRNLRGDRECQSALAEAPHECLGRGEPFEELRASKRSRCGVAWMCFALGKPFALFDLGAVSPLGNSCVSRHATVPRLEVVCLEPEEFPDALLGFFRKRVFGLCALLLRFESRSCSTDSFLVFSCKLCRCFY